MTTSLIQAEPVATYTLARSKHPAGTGSHWRFEPPEGYDKLTELASAGGLDIRTLRQAVTLTRQGATADQVARATSIDVETVRGAIADLGATIGQALKGNAVHARDVMETGRGARVGLAPGIHHTAQGITVVASQGWAGRGRDIRRAYSHVMLADHETIQGALSRHDHLRSTDVTAQHLRDYWVADHLGMFRLDHVVAAGAPADAYVQVISMVHDALRDSAHAVSRLTTTLRRRRAHAGDLDAAYASWWVLPGYGNALRVAGELPDTTGEAWMEAWASRVVNSADDPQDPLRPRSLRTVSRAQLKALTHILGLADPRQVGVVQ